MESEFNIQGLGGVGFPASVHDLCLIFYRARGFRSRIKFLKAQCSQDCSAEVVHHGA